jgi:hypothetical protein
MPYRRLPNTDAARRKALSIAYKLGHEIPPFKLAFTQSTFQRVQSFLPIFEKVLQEVKNAYMFQVNRNKDYLRIQKKAKIYISHFIQVVNMAMQRGDLPETERSYFGMGDNLQKLPPLNSESDVITWGEKLIHGEEIRKGKGLAPITNPTIAVLKVRYEQFLDAYKSQKTLQKSYQRAQEQLVGLRKEADQIILSIWNEVEKSYAELPENERRKMCERFGIIYVFRKDELKQTNNHTEAVHS